MSRRGAAKRFGIAPSTAIKWVRAWRLTGSYRPRPQGGDRRSHRIEARAETVLALVEETPDMTLAEIAAHLENEHGLRVSQSTVWRFLFSDIALEGSATSEMTGWAERRPGVARL